MVAHTKNGGTRTALTAHDNGFSEHIATVYAAEGEGGAPLALDGLLMEDHEVIEVMESGNGCVIAGEAAAKTRLADLNTVGVDVHVGGAGKGLAVAAAREGGAGEKALESGLVHDDSVDELAGEVLAVAASVDGHGGAAGDGVGKGLGNALVGHTYDNKSKNFFLFFKLYSEKMG